MPSYRADLASERPASTLDRSEVEAKLRSLDISLDNRQKIPPEKSKSYDDDILSLDDSIDERQEPTKSDSASVHAGPLEDTLMRSPIRRAKKKEIVTPKGNQRKGLGLGRFIRKEVEQDNSERENERDVDVAPIWEYSDIMSVGAGSMPGVPIGGDDFDDNKTVMTKKSVATYHPGTTPIASKKNMSSTLWDRAAKTIDAKRSGNDDSSAPPRRIQSLEPRRLEASSGSRRKLKDMSASEHVATNNKVPIISPSFKDTKSLSKRMLVPSKASIDLSGIDFQSPVNRTGHQSRPTSVDKKKDRQKKEKSKKASASPQKDKESKKKLKRKKERSQSMIEGVDIAPKLPHRVSEEKKTKTKKKRSKSLSRVTLYEHDETIKRNPNRRRAGKKDSPSVMTSDDIGRGSRSVSRSPRPGPVSRRKLLMKVESDSVVSAPIATSSTRRPSGAHSLSPRPGKRSTSQLPRRGEAKQNQSPSQQTLKVKLPKRAGSRRKIERNESPRRKASSGGVSVQDRRKLMERVESVNSFFGKGAGEVGAAYPSQRNLKDEETPKKPESVRRKMSKFKKPKSMRHIAL